MKKTRKKQVRLSREQFIEAVKRLGACSSGVRRLRKVLRDLTVGEAIELYKRCHTFNVGHNEYPVAGCPRVDATRMNDFIWLTRQLRLSGYYQNYAYGYRSAGRVSKEEILRAMSMFIRTGYVSALDLSTLEQLYE